MKVQIDKSVEVKANEFNRYFTSMNGVDVSQKITVDRDEWRSLYASIRTALAASQEPASQAVEPEPVAWMYKEMLTNDRQSDAFTAREYVQLHRNPYHHRLSEHTPLYTHPAPAQAVEPVANVNITTYKGYTNHDFEYFGNLPNGCYSLYTHPAKPMSEEDQFEVFRRAEQRIAADHNLSWRIAIIQETESMHRIKEAL